MDSFHESVEGVATLQKRMTTISKFVQTCIEDVAATDSNLFDKDAWKMTWAQIFKRTQELTSPMYTAKSQSDWAKIETTLQTQISRKSVGDLRAEVTAAMNEDSTFSLAQEDCDVKKAPKPMLAAALVQRQLARQRAEEKHMQESWVELVNTVLKLDQAEGLDTQMQDIDEALAPQASVMVEEEANSGYARLSPRTMDDAQGSLRVGGAWLAHMAASAATSKLLVKYISPDENFKKTGEFFHSALDCGTDLILVRSTRATTSTSGKISRVFADFGSGEGGAPNIKLNFVGRVSTTMQHIPTHGAVAAGPPML